MKAARVKTICSTGESDWSGQPKFTTGGCATPNINKFQLESNSVNAVTLQWERVANAVDYEIEYSAIAGDVIASDKKGERPLTASFEATVEFTEDGKAILSDTNQAQVKY